MNAKALFALPLLLGVVLAGCDKPADGPASEKEQVIVVKLPGAPTSRAVETPQAGGSKTASLDDVTVFLMAGQLVKQVEVFTQPEREAGSKRIEQVPGEITDVIVVANAYNTGIESLPNETSIKNYAFTVASQYTKSGLEGRTLMGAGQPVVKTSDPLSGPTAEFPDHNSTHIYKEVEIELSAITSRIEVGDVTPGTGVEEVELLAVYVNNYYTTNAKDVTILNKEDSDKWPLIPASPSKTAIDFDIAGKIVPANYSEANYVDAYNSTVSLHADSKAYAYHVFSGNLPHVILLVKGKYATGHIPLEDGTNAEMPYFIGWVTFTKYHESAISGHITAMEGNHIYKMGVGTTGIPINKPDVRPLPEPENYDLGIRVEILGWTQHVVTPEV